MKAQLGNQYSLSFSLKWLLLIIITINIIQCENQAHIQQLPKTIQFYKEIFSFPPDIPNDYSIAKSIQQIKNSNNQGAQVNTINGVNPATSIKNRQIFTTNKPADYFVKKSSDTKYQQQRVKNLKGKDIFDKSYLKDHNQLVQLLMEIKSLDIPKQKVSKQIQQFDYHDDDKKIQQKSAEPSESTNKQRNQLYNQFKNIDNLKKELLIPDSSWWKGYQKIVLYIIIGLALGILILKKARLQKPKLPKINEQKHELRLKDTYDNGDDESDGSESD